MVKARNLTNLLIINVHPREIFPFLAAFPGLTTRSRARTAVARKFSVSVPRDWIGVDPSLASKSCRHIQASRIQGPDRHGNINPGWASLPDCHIIPTGTILLLRSGCIILAFANFGFNFQVGCKVSLLFICMSHAGIDVSRDLDSSITIAQR